ncbi:MAG: nucleotidyl transferase AbiEii/AbiGii toxin family protein [Planctomycetes bacterium]|nr:nucleotidyl transferase AbiEii/AbiGii toxin family protein [Planctomycetota bacterium]
MAVTDLLAQVAAAFDENRVPFLLIGGMAVSTWIEERLTRDVDIIAMVRRGDASRLKSALIASGTRVTALEMRLLFERRFLLLKTAGPRLDVKVATGAHDRAAFEHAGRVDIQGHPVAVASAEDLVLYKLMAWRPQDRADVHRLLREIRDLRRSYVESWLDRLSADEGADLRVRWAEALKEAGK